MMPSLQWGARGSSRPAKWNQAWGPYLRQGRQNPYNRGQGQSSHAQWILWYKTGTILWLVLFFDTRQVLNPFTWCLGASHLSSLAFQSYASYTSRYQPTYLPAKALWSTDLLTCLPVVLSHKSFECHHFCWLRWASMCMLHFQMLYTPPSWYSCMIWPKLLFNAMARSFASVVLMP